MKFFDRIFKGIYKNFLSIKDYGNIYRCSIDSPDNILLNKSSEILSGLTIDMNNNVNSAFLNSILIIPKYNLNGEMRARIDVFLRIARELHYFPFAGEKGTIYISTLSNKDGDIKSEYHQLNNLFEKIFGHSINFSKIIDNNWNDEVEQHIKDTYRFYVEEHGSWLESFIAHLGDDLSRDSFNVFLRQRIMASIFDNSPICYPVLPPAKTAAWRQMREKGTYNFPVLHGVSKEVLHNLFYKYIYIYEQYAIPGIVEANIGNTVADVGAFIGDTACYFSKKVGNNGKVLSFEVSQESIDFAKKNMIINGCNNVKIVPYALSDKSGYLPLSLVCGDASSNTIINDDIKHDELERKIKTITLDEYCDESNEKIDFIKADIEGSEMSMLRGAARTISTYAPVCAICLYHKKNDLWEIPEYLRNLCPEYQFYFRCEAEPVLFAKRVR